MNFPFEFCALNNFILYCHVHYPI
jgi:hypothetical protein